MEIVSQLTLTHANSRGCSVLQNLVKSGSSILDPSNKEHWEQIQKSEGGTAHLLRNFEDYANTLAQNVRKTYLRPFTIVTDNMSEWRSLFMQTSAEHHNL